MFIPQGEFNGQVLVYEHGASTAKATLNSPLPALDCSVDPSSENVAVTTGFGNGIVIFPYSPQRGWRFAKVYSDPHLPSFAFCAYDNHGNLFADGADAKGNFALAELPKGSKTFSTITVDQNIGFAGSMQWLGKYLSIADLGPNGGSITDSVIYRFAISGSSGTRVSTTTLDLSLAHAQFWIQGNKVIGPVSYDSVRAIGFWSFPAGGAPIKMFSDTIPFGETVSVK